MSLTPPVPRRFYLHRTNDPTGISGTGAVAVGVLWPSGHVTVEWTGKHRSEVSWPSLEDLKAVSCHNGMTAVVWLDPAPEQP